jgi:hypothetical protein
MYADYLKGHGYQAIAKALNDEGVRTPRGNVLSVITVQRILDSGFGAGYLRIGVNVRDRNGKRIEQPVRLEKGAHKPVIDEPTWQAYLRERDKRRVVHPKARQPHWFLGGGLTVCGRCGGNLIVNSYSAAKSQAACSNYKAKRSCDGVWINRTTVEREVALWLGGRVVDWADRQDELQGADNERAALARDLEAARSDEQRVADGLNTAARLVATGMMSEADYIRARGDAEAERRRIVQRADELRRQHDALSPDTDVYDRLQRGADGQTPEEWNAVLRRVIRRVVVSPDTITIEPWRGDAQVIDRKSIRVGRKHGTRDCSLIY